MFKHALPARTVFPFTRRGGGNRAGHLRLAFRTFRAALLLALRFCVALDLGFGFGFVRPIDLRVYGGGATSIDINIAAAAIALSLGPLTSHPQC